MRGILAAVLGTPLALFGIGPPGDTRLDFPDQHYSSSDFNLGCEVVTESSAFENRLNGSPTANAHAGKGTEKLALNLSSDGKTLSLLYAYAVSTGDTDPIKLAVHTKTNAYILATAQDTMSDTAIILDIRTLKGVISHTGMRAGGIIGSSSLIQCR
jgi:hypothetical protein